MRNPVSQKWDLHLPEDPIAAKQAEVKVLALWFYCLHVWFICI